MSMVLLLALVSAVVAGGAIAWWVVAASRDRAERSLKLPAGADAAIWSIVEAVPDPRNHLALTRDLTGEVRITGTPLDAWREHAEHLERAS
jgi:hypothetical protein